MNNGIFDKDIKENRNVKSLNVKFQIEEYQ